MIPISDGLKAALNSAANQPIDVYELYLDSGTLYFADQDFTWNGNHYVGKVKSRSTIKRYEGGQFDNVSVTCSNVDTTLAQILLQTEIEGRKLIVRKVERTVAGDSIVLFNGRMERVSRITEEEAVIDAKALIGGIDFDVPARCFSPYCPWDLASFECGYAGPETACDKSWARCSQLGNTPRFGGFRFFPHSGTFQYKEIEKQRFLLFFSRKKEKTVTAAFTAVDDTPYDVPIPWIFGRVQIAGIVIEHEDQGAATKALVAFCAGPIENIYYLRANQSYVTDWTPHQGQLGGGGGQTVDARFPGSYPYNLLAYAGVTIPSDVAAVDPAPDITAVIQGRGARIFGPGGVFDRWAWTDNPVWCLLEFLSIPLAQGGMGISDDDIDFTVSAEAAAYCDEVIQDTTNDQKIYNPPSLAADAAYERYRSTGVVEGDPTVDGPYSDYELGVDDDTSTQPAPIPVKRFTANVALAKPEKAVDVLFQKLLPSFRGFITYSKEGKIQVRVEKAAKNSTAAENSQPGGWQIACSNPSQWSVGEKLIASPLTANAEVLTIGAVGADRLTFTTQSLHDHAYGAELLKVEMAFDGSNIIGDFEYPLSDRQPSTNRVTIKYVDAPAGFESRELRVNDYAHQAKVHRVDNEDLDGSAIDSYFQAYRIGEWRRAKLRDLGKFCSIRVDIKATPLEIGDVIAVSAAEAGLAAVPFRVIEMGYRDDDEVELVGQVYSSAVYDDYAPQATVTVPTIFSPVQPPGQTPAAPNVVAATCTLTYRQWNNVSLPVFGGLATLAVDRTHLAAIVVSAVSPAGKITPIARYEAPFGATLDYSGWSPDVQQTGADQMGWSVTFTVYNEAGTPTPGPYPIPGITIAAAATSSVIAFDASALATNDPNYVPRWKDSSEALHVVLKVNVTVPAGQTMPVTGWLTKADGIHLWQGWQTIAGAGVIVLGAQGSNTAVYPPINADENWTVTCAAGAYESWQAPPAGAVTSAPFLVKAPAIPTDTAATGGTLSDYFTVRQGDGSYLWGFTISATLPYDDPEFWFARFSRSVGHMAAGVFMPGTDWEGPELAFCDDQPLGPGNGLTKSRTGNVLSIHNPGTWGFPPPILPDGSPNPNNICRFYCDIGSRRGGGAVTRQKVWSGGTQDHYDITLDASKAQVDARLLDPGTLGAGLIQDPVSKRPMMGQDGSGNIFVNPGFEQGSTGWTFTFTDIVTSPVFSGTQAARIAAAAYYGLSQTMLCKPGEKYAAGFKVKQDAGFTGSMYIVVNFCSDTSGTTLLSQIFPASLSTDTTWKDLIATFTIPSGAMSFTVIVCPSVTSAGKYFYVDNGYCCLQIPVGYTMAVDASGNVVLSNLPSVLGLPTLPSASYPAGSVVVLSGDGKVYRNPSGSAWVKSTDPQDLIAGAVASGVTVNAAQVNAGTFNGFTFVGCTMSLTANGIETSINNSWDATFSNYFSFLTKAGTYAVGIRPQYVQLFEGSGMTAYQTSISARSVHTSSPGGFAAMDSGATGGTITLQGPGAGIWINGVKVL